ncbi:hypothetical protein GGH94_005240 [Coemansia aciculifera]|uniref:Protein YTP1-like C-terminal domain-containing protein n=1 Tax=Coemansia aciculifera TaxID=417176 RepID=A0A9W8M422_9FUNG|nr:hypothetical protein GGH94_005240 [Coemansia aciculifera]KAJ2871053.1 hypothetical protein GGH93_005115 [Coemansia aciculifera]
MDMDMGGGHSMEHSSKLPDDAMFYHWPDQPMTWALRTHLLLCFVGYVVLLPIGLVMEMARYKYQSIMQMAGALFALIGILFGWVNGHLDNIYARFGWFMLMLLVGQTAISVCMDLGMLGRTRRIDMAYRGIGVAQFFFTYVAMVFGVTNYLGLCSRGHLGQCISHFARGSGLMMSSMLLLVGMRVCGPMMLNLRRPPEFYASIVMMTVGLIGTFTEHNFFQSSASASWSHKDLQHTFIGVSWLAGGLLGVLMTWRNSPRDRTAIPSIIYIATGISMIIHQQDLKMASHTHFLFGAALVCLGISSICEVALMASGFVQEKGEPESFQYMPVLFMCLSGIFLMGSNRDMILFLINSQIDIVTYALLLSSVCFVVILYFCMLSDLYLALRQLSPVVKYRRLAEDAAV